MKKLYIKVITGFREDQFYSISSEEAAKAYYLFLHPEERGVFDNGVALIGKHIQGIEPDYNSTMGWNKTYQLGAEDYAEIRSEGIDTELQNTLSNAKYIATNHPKLVTLPLSHAIKEIGGNREKEVPHVQERDGLKKIHVQSMQRLPKPFGEVA